MLTWIAAIDVWILIAVQGALGFLVEWFSWRQRSIERVLIAAYAGGFIASVELNHEARWSYIGLAFGVYGLISLHRAPNQHRLVRLFSAERSEVLARVGILVASLFCCGAELVWPDRFVMDVVVICVFAIALYVMALPSGGTPGRKRKAAVAKIVDSFGKEYVPEAA